MRASHDEEQITRSVFAEIALELVMARTFVRVELEFADAETGFSTAMAELGFVQTVKGRNSGKKLLLPSGMYLIERTSPAEALELTRQAARLSNVRARIFCVPVGGDIRFGNLQAEQPYARG
jgi:hypothetical protein